MRLLAVFFIGLIASFFLGEAINRIFKRPLPTPVGLLLIVAGFLMGFQGFRIVSPPLDILLSMLLLGTGLGFTFHHLMSQSYLISEKHEHAFVSKHQHGFTRFIEILPGALTWIGLTSPLWLSFTLPFAVAYFVLIAQIYWMISAVRMAILIILGYRKMEWAKRQHWLERLKKDHPDEWEDYYHVFLLPTYKESLEVLGPAFDAITSLNYPKEKVMLAVGFEERANPREFHKETIKYLEDEISKKVGKVIMSFHPADLPGEIAGPGTNRNWMVKTIVKELEEKNIPLEKVIATTLDCDFVVHHELLAGMLHKYLSVPEKQRLHRSFTGAFLYYNNYWQAPTPMRLLATGTAFWQIAEMVGSDKYQNFSSLSINLKSLVSIGGWIPDKVNDDSGFYWKAYFHYKGDYKVLPHFLPISADAVLDVNLIKTIQNQYLQLKRWAYGVEHLPFIFTQYFKNKDIDFWDRTDKLLFVLWANLRWGFLAFFVTFAGLLIPYLNPQYNESVVAVNLPIVSSWILTAAFIGLFATIYVHERTVPPRPKSWSPIRKMWSYMQTLLVPLVLVTISTLPAIDAQTSLMFGRYMGFRTTNKARINIE
jgi:hypothetical protein